jgi:TonB family protein
MLPLSAQAQTVTDAPGVTVDLGGGSVLHRTPVMYPEAALRTHVQGIVTVEATLDPSGNVTDARVMSGPQELRRAALQSILQWHFSMDSSLLTRRVNINFTTPQAPDRVEGGRTSIGVVGGVVSGTPGGVPGGVISSVPNGRVPVAPPSLAGKTLTEYRVSGLSDQAKSDLLSRLPVKAGEVLGEHSFEDVAKAVHEYDEHLTVGRMLGRGMNNNEVGIMIMAPGAGASMAMSSSPAVPPPTGDTKRITIGGNVQQAKLVRQPRPEYPPLAKQARIQGVVQLQVVIAADGTVKDIAVISGHPLLVPAALDAVKQWQYQPTLLNGQPVEVLTQVDVNFTLSDQPAQQQQQ